MNILALLNDKLLISESEAAKFAATAPHRYKKYLIPKRNGKGHRRIAHPSRELKFVQRLLVQELADKLLVHDLAMAYRQGVSIRQNAEVHLATKYLLKMDFKDFFPSIKPNLFFKIANRQGVEFDEKSTLALSNLLFYKLTRVSPLQLSIGAPSSPLVSNAVMYYFDCEMANLCQIMGVNYSRYADDLTFSTNTKEVLFYIPELVKQALLTSVDGEILVNDDKTVFSSKAHNRHVTGITLTNDGELSVGRAKKRAVSSAIHNFRLGLLSVEEANRLMGQIAFVCSIEPLFYGRMVRKYGESVLSKLMRGVK